MMRYLLLALFAAPVLAADDAPSVPLQVCRQQRNEALDAVGTLVEEITRLRKELAEAKAK